MSGNHTSKVWTVTDSTEEAKLELVKKFIDFCEQEAAQLFIDQEVISALQKIKEMNKKPPPGFDKNDIFKLKNYLQAMTTVSVYGYNSSRYDLAVIFDLIIKAYDRPGFDRKSVNLLKKGTAYFSCQFGTLHFKDLQNFTCPVSLDTYLKTWSNDLVKMVYPYEKFSSIEEIRNQKTFPPIEDFTSRLKPNIDIGVYNECKKIFNRRIALPNGHSDKWSSFDFIG